MSESRCGWVGPRGLSSKANGSNIRVRVQKYGIILVHALLVRCNTDTICHSRCFAIPQSDQSKSKDTQAPKRRPLAATQTKHPEEPVKRYQSHTVAPLRPRRRERGGGERSSMS